METSKIFLNKLKNWEYWPTFMFYIPNLPYALYLAIKARSLTFYTAANPILKSSGNGTESKYETIKLIPKKYRPKTILVTPNENIDLVFKKIEIEKIEFPVIAKPDIGFRGLLVKKINTETELEEYLKKYPIDIIIQEFISYKNECGIFYYRLPNQEKGNITSITLKKFLSLIGDGKSTLSELILNDKRASIYYAIFKEIHKEELNSIPKKETPVLLSSIGNHSKGAQFKNGNDLKSNELTTVIQEIEQQIDGWYYGRLDIKYESFEKILSDNEFKILEINGIISEPTHVFDASTYSYFNALKSIRNHWKILYNVSTENHLFNNIEYIKPQKFIKEVQELRTYIKMVKGLNLQ
jgi:hypothetical protein